jgi:hypothetical protein
MKKMNVVFALTFLFSFGVVLKYFHNSTPVTVAQQKTATFEREPAAATPEASCIDLINQIINNYELNPTLIKEVKVLLKAYDISEAEINNVKSYHDAIDKVYKKIQGTDPTSIAKSEKMVKFGKELRVLYTAADIKPDQVLDLDFVLAKRIMNLEQFTPAEFRVGDESSFALARNTRLYHIDYKHYKDYVLAFEAQPQLALYTNLDRSGGTIISRTDIREIEAHNLFPVYIDHDMRHVGYALNHERYFPMLFAAARSKNHMRYVMMGALSEGVDRVQYAEESAICRYFDGVKHLTLEEGMMWVGRASLEDLNEVANAIQQKPTFDSLAKVFDAWAPPVSPKYPAAGQSGVGLDQELIDMYLSVKKSHTDPDLVERYRIRQSAPLHW